MVKEMGKGGNIPVRKWLLPEITPQDVASFHVGPDLCGNSLGLLTALCPGSHDTTFHLTNVFKMQ